MPETPVTDKPHYRLHAIDVFRALTMMLMIFVNDLWTLREIPKWLGHVPAAVDGMGLADVVFPAFLFIVGLSLPFAIDNRKSKGQDNLTIFRHIFLRSLALIIMGVYHVNLESYNRELAFLPKQIWQIAATIGFFMVWLDYSKYSSPKKKTIIQILGILVLLGLALLYKGGSVENPQWMRFHWWGILGLIGWGYLVVATMFLLSMGKIQWLWVSFFFLLGFNITEELGYLEWLKVIKPYIWLIDNGATPASCMGGVLVAMYYRELFRKGHLAKFWSISLGMVLVAIVFGLWTRPVWGIHKIGSSPSWVTICLGLSILAFLLIIWIVEIRGRKNWFDLIKPAGTSTLTCYLLPYIYYGVLGLTGLYLPIVLRTGGIGIVKSLLFALLIIIITGFLEKARLRLKI